MSWHLWCRLAWATTISNGIKRFHTCHWHFCFLLILHKWCKLGLYLDNYTKSQNLLYYCLLSEINKKFYVKVYPNLPLLRICFSLYIFNHVNHDIVVDNICACNSTVNHILVSVYLSSVGFILIYLIKCIFLIDLCRFIRKTFKLAWLYLQPDIIVFLGDLFDEGSTATADQFKITVHRFHSLFKIAPEEKVCNIFTYSWNLINLEKRERNLKSDVEVNNAKISRFIFRESLKELRNLVSNGNSDRSA